MCELPLPLGSTLGWFPPHAVALVMHPFPHRAGAWPWGATTRRKEGESDTPEGATSEGALLLCIIKILLLKHNSSESVSYLNCL